jgi:hypothetical protein
MGFEVLTAVSMKMAVFWVVVPYSLVEIYHRFRGPCCLHHQHDYKALQPRRQPSPVLWDSSIALLKILLSGYFDTVWTLKLK